MEYAKLFKIDNIIKFEYDDFEINVSPYIENEKVRLFQDEITSLFDVDYTQIVKHISNIHKKNN